MGERFLVTLMSAGSLFSAEATLETGIDLSDGFRSILAIAFLDEERKYKASWRSGQFERHLFGFS